MKPKKTIAIFDFDGTLTRHDTLLPFLFFCFGKIETCIGLLFNSIYIVAYLIKLIPNNIAKKKLLLHFFKNKNKTIIEEKALKFTQTKIDKYLRKNLIKRLKWHQKKGHKTILISASINTYIRLWAEKYNIDYVEATNLEIKNNRYSGEILGENCYGEEKLVRLNKILNNDINNYKLFGYGDSAGDKQFLEKCDVKYSKKDFNKL